MFTKALTKKFNDVETFIEEIEKINPVYQERAYGDIRFSFDDEENLLCNGSKITATAIEQMCSNIKYPKANLKVLEIDRITDDLNSLLSRKKQNATTQVAFGNDLTGNQAIIGFPGQRTQIFPSFFNDMNINEINLYDGNKIYAINKSSEDFIELAGEKYRRDNIINLSLTWIYNLIIRPFITRLVCENGMTVEEKRLNTISINSKSYQVGVNIPQLIDSYDLDTNILSHSIQNMKNTKIPDIENLDEKLYPKPVSEIIPEKKIYEIMDQAVNGENMYDIHNYYTELSSILRKDYMQYDLHSNYEKKANKIMSAFMFDSQGEKEEMLIKLI